MSAEWNLEGLFVSGKYLGEFDVFGKVDLSRVKYGGGVSHHIQLEDPIEVYGQIRDRVILDHESVESVFSSY